MQALRSLIDSINADEETRAAETFRFMEEQKIKKALGPALWEDLKTKFEQSCVAIEQSSPLRLEFLTDGINEITIVNAKNGKTAVLSYNSDVPCVFYRTPKDKGQMTFRVSPDGNAVQFIVNGIPRSILDEIATVIISQIT
jgi:hypothetical protein